MNMKRRRNEKKKEKGNTISYGIHMVLSKDEKKISIFSLINPLLLKFRAQWSTSSNLEFFKVFSVEKVPCFGWKERENVTRKKKKIKFLIDNFDHKEKKKTRCKSNVERLTGCQDKPYNRNSNYAASLNYYWTAYPSMRLLLSTNIGSVSLLLFSI